MRAKAARSPGRLARVAVTALILTTVGCGGGNYSRPTQPSPQPSTGPSGSSAMEGGWEIFFQSDLDPSEFIVLEANLSKTDKHVFSEANGALIFHGQGSMPYQPVISVSHLGGECNSAGADEITFDGTFANPNLGAQAIAFTLTENGTLGSAVMTASASVTATGAMSGTYTLPAACGFPEDHGTISGYEPSTKFSAVNVYRGTVAGNAVVVGFDSVNGGVGASANGTYNGTRLAMTGFASGEALTLTGTISGQEISWFALYDSLYNTFRIYDSGAKLLGGLTESP